MPSRCRLPGEPEAPICPTCAVLSVPCGPRGRAEPDLDHAEQLRAEIDVERMLGALRRRVPRIRFDAVTELVLRMHLGVDGFARHGRPDHRRN